MRNPVGIDLNGWHDFGCRDWQVEDPDARVNTPVIVDGGWGAVIVEHGDVHVGGPQAILSPIGRGNGWGEVGALAKRRRLVDHWSSFLAGEPSVSFAGDIRASADAVSVQADQLVVCMPDRSEMSEARQQGLLTALAGPRRPRATLLWRPVALLLDLLDGNKLAEAVDGLRVACLIHCHDGLEAQRLVLRRLPERPDRLAPERAGPGIVCCPDLGLDRLLAHAIAAVAAANPGLAERPAETPRLPWDLLYRDGEPPTEQVVRRDNGTWLMVHAPRAYALPDAPLDIGAATADSDLAVLLSPLAAAHRERLADRLAGELVSVKLMLADPTAAARGALFAARRIERNIPHYLDRLDQVSLVVSRREGPVFEDLVPPNAFVPGNREYVSAPITSMRWPARMAQANFYIRKGARQIRHWTTPPVAAPDRPERLEIRLRQMPAQGWARLSVTAPDWDELRRAPIHLDWDALPIDPRMEAEILAGLERPRPVVPRRVRYAANLGLWDGSLRYPGVLAALRAFNSKSSASVKLFADTIRASFRVTAVGLPDRKFETVYPVGTDGELPEGLDDATRQHFDDGIHSVAETLLQAIRRRRPALDNNNALLSLTWVFARCPIDVQHEMIAALDDRTHPLLAPRQSDRVLVHGLGRVVTDGGLLRLLISRLRADLNRPNFLAALSSLLSRPHATPGVLSDGEVEAIAVSAVRILRQMRTAGQFGVNFKYALLLVGGLLRVRERDPWALLAEASPTAGALVEELSAILTRIEIMSRMIRNEAQKREIISNLIELLSSEGGTPDILIFVETMPDL